MKTALESFIKRHALEDVIHAQAIQLALDEEREMIVKAYENGVDDAVKSIANDIPPSGAKYYKKAFVWC